MLFWDVDNWNDKMLCISSTQMNPQLFKFTFHFFEVELFFIAMQVKLNSS